MWKKVIYLFIFVTILSTIIGCSGGNPVVPPIDNADLPEYNEIIADNQVAIDQYVEYNSSYSTDIARQKMLEWLEEQNNIKRAGISEDGTVWFEYENGILVGFLPEDEEENKNISRNSFKSVSNSLLNTKSSTNKSTPSNEKAIVLAPYSILDQGKTDAIREKILSIGGFSCDNPKVDSEVTIEVIKELYQYGIVYIVTHGGIIDDDVCIGLNHIITYNFYNTYESDFLGEDEDDPNDNRLRFAVIYPWSESSVAIAPPFISYYANGSYPNSLIYIDACHSLKETDMAKAFIDAGAHTYCGYHSLTFAPLTCDLTAFDSMIYLGMSVKDAIDNTDCNASVLGFMGLDYYSEREDDLYLKPLNHAPVIFSLIADPSSIDINQTTTITCTATDEDFGDFLFFEYNWSKNGGSFEGDTSGSSVTWRAPSTEGNYTITCEVSDGKGGEDTDSINIVVTESDEEDSITLNAWTITGYDPYCIMIFDDEYIPNRSIFVYWSKISNAEGYKVYRSVNGSNSFDLVYSGDGIFHDSLNVGAEEIGWFDFNTNPGNSYSYKVSYVKDGQESTPSKIITRSVWLPECSLKSPTDYNPEDPNDQPVIDPNQLLQWNSVNISYYPYQGKIFSGMTEIWVCYYDTPYPVAEQAENIWSESFNNLITSSVRFNPNNADTPLIPGEDHIYAWETRAVGYDNNGEVIAMSWSGARHFFYMGPSAF